MKWISVKERLPEVGAPVGLAWIGEKCDSYDKGIWAGKKWGCPIHGAAFKEPPTHWMPLPDKPKEKT